MSSFFRDSSVRRLDDDLRHDFFGSLRLLAATRTLQDRLCCSERALRRRAGGWFHPLRGPLAEAWRTCRGIARAAERRLAALAGELADARARKGPALVRHRGRRHESWRHAALALARDVCDACELTSPVDGRRLEPDQWPGFDRGGLTGEDLESWRGWFRGDDPEAVDPFDVYDDPDPFDLVRGCVVDELRVRTGLRVDDDLDVCVWAETQALHRHRRRSRRKLRDSAQTPRSFQDGTELPALLPTGATAGKAIEFDEPVQVWHFRHDGAAASDGTPARGHAQGQPPAFFSPAADAGVEGVKEGQLDDPPPADDQVARPLRKLEADVLRFLPPGARLPAKKLASKVGRKRDSRFRTELSAMRKAGLLDHVDGQGYGRGPKAPPCQEACHADVARQGR